MRTGSRFTKSAFLFMGLCAATSVVWMASRGVRSDEPGPVPAGSSDGLTVHEWGTFTSFAGSDGIKLDFRPLVDGDLPPFVLDRWEQEGLLKNPFAKRSLTALQRMETPVIYFYSDTEREVNVKVGFPEGLITEFYPPVESQLPPVKPFSTKPEVAANSEVNWGRVWLIPTKNLATHVGHPSLTEAVNRRVVQSIPPRVYADSHYLPARNTDSALVYVNRPGSSTFPNAPRGDYFEKFLFYRGIGNFELPLSVEASGGGKFTATNAGPSAIRALFLVNLTGDTLRFARYDQIGPEQELTMELPASANTIDELADAVASALVDEKLYEKEARAMVDTWRSSWFGEEGTRLFYALPDRVTDALLPLEISPRPDELVRVLVGRLEIMTPEDEQKMTELVRDSVAIREFLERQAAAKSEDISKVQPQIPKSISRMGRLAEPMLVRVEQSAKDPQVRKEAGILLKQLIAAMGAAENRVQ